MIFKLVAQAPVISLGGLKGISGASSLGEIFSNFLNAVMPLMAMVFVAVIIYGGYMYMMAQGDPAKLKQASSIVTNAVVGLIIVALAFVIKSIVGGVLNITF